MKKILVFFSNIFMILLLLINRIIMFFSNIITTIVNYLSLYNNKQYIKKYKLEKYIVNEEIDVQFFYDEDEKSALLIIRGNEYTLSEEEVEIFLNIFTSLNKKIIINGNFKVRDN